MPIEPTFSALLSLDYGDSSGSGFKVSYKNRLYLVTAKHVLYNEENHLRCNSVVMTSQKVRGNETDSRIIEINMQAAQIFPSAVDDIAIVLLENEAAPADYLTIIQEGILDVLSIDINNVENINDVEIASEVLLVGFPTSLIFQETKYFDISRPLLRKGIIAGFNQADNTFIIDCPSYYGNSGGPVLLVKEDNSLSIIGLVSRYIPFMITWKNNRESSITHTEFSNSGYSVCIPINAVINLIESTLN